MHILAFLKPTRLRIKLFIILVLYLFIAALLLSSYNTARSVGEPHYTAVDDVIMIAGYPAIFLILPLNYSSEHVFTHAVTLRQVYEKSGMVGLSSDYDPILDEPVQSPTSWSIAAGVVVEFAFLYLLACLLSLLKRRPA